MSRVRGGGAGLAVGRSRRRAGVLAPLARRLVLGRLQRIEGARLEVLDADGLTACGPAESALGARVVVHDPRTYTSVLARGALGAGEAFGEGHWTADDLTSALRILLRNRPVLDALDAGPARLSRALLRGVLARRDHSRARSQRDVVAHYDLGDGFFALFLDETMTYSAGVFPHADTTLAEASTEKIDRFCRKLGLRPGMRVLEIGCGWGSFAEHAAARYGCEVVGTTISPAQHAYAARRMARAGLGDCVTIVDRDYRDLSGTFDRVVSIEMIEAVGHENLGRYLATVEARLAPGGLAGLQAIVIDDRHYDRARKTMDFIKRHVFPGSFIPSRAAIRDALARDTNLALTDSEEIGLHYAETLRRWRARFDARSDALGALGFDARFRRYWHYYLAYCEAGFRERFLGDVQLVLRRP